MHRGSSPNYELEADVLLRVIESINKQLECCCVHSVLSFSLLSAVRVAVNFRLDFLTDRTPPVATDLCVTGEEDLTHAARAELLYDPVMRDRL